MMTPSNLRRAAGVSGTTMNTVYDLLRTMTVEQLKEMWGLLNPIDNPADCLLRWQLFVTAEKKAEGVW